MTTWKRWSWRYRIGALFALVLLLQGAACPLPPDNTPTYDVRNVGKVVGQRYYDSRKNQYYFLVVVEEKDGAKGYRYVYERDNAAEYWYIDFTLLNIYGHPPGTPDRAGIPGGAGGLPAPAVQ